MEILTINKANCKDCYKCIRHCPVNAIKVIDGHAQVDPDRCILDGGCYKICPQNAKSIRNDIEMAKLIIKNNSNVIASIAPSFFAYYKEEKRNKIYTALTYLGFDRIEQTSRAADTVAMQHFEHYKKSNDITITSSCPAVVSLIEKYYPELIKYIAPVISPAVAHYKIIEKETKTPFKMVFIGPCIAKKRELEDSQISICLSFEELEEWIEQENIDLSTLEPMPDTSPMRVSGLFPLLGGLIKTAGLNDSNLNRELISVNGIDNIKKLSDSIRAGNIKTGFIEVLACEGGCVMGPVRPKEVQDCTYYELRKNLIESLPETNPQPTPSMLSEKALSRTYSNKSLNLIKPTEAEIKVILASIGKTKPEDEHNCGACGYNSCREKAIAVIQGMAENEMCIPYMRSQAEKFSTIVLECTPNGVVVVDKNLNIIEANPAFLKLIEATKEEIKGVNISTIVDDEPFRQVLDQSYLVLESCTIYKDKKLKRIVFSVPDQKILTGIFVDITDAETHKEALTKVKNETLERAQKVIDKQMRVAQEIAGILGETTAETKVLLGQLVKILQQD